MFGSNKRYISVCINETSVKIAQVRASGEIEKVAHAQAQDTSVDAIAKILKTLLNGFDRKAPAVCVVPASASSAKNIEVPSVDQQEIRSIINLQASRHTPYSKDEVLISFLNLGPSSVGNTKVLLVIAHRNTVKERLSAMEIAGLNTDRVCFAPEGMARLVSKSLTKKDVGPVAVIDGADHYTNFLVLLRGQVLFSRSIPIGSSDLVEGSDASAKFVEELNKSLTSYQGEDIGALPGSLLITTDNQKLKDLLPSLAENLKTEVRFSPYTSMVKLSAVLKKRLEKDYVNDSFLDVIGAGVFAGQAQVQLMPQEIVIKRAVEEQSKQATKAGLFALVAMVLVGGILMSKIYFKDTFLNKNLKEQYAPQKEEVKELKQRLDKVQVVRDYMATQLISLETLKELYKITPDTVYLNNISLDEEGNMSIDGVADTMSMVFTYVKSLDDSSLFKGAKTKSTAIKKERGKDVAAFEITMKLESATKE